MNGLVDAITREAPEYKYFFIMAPGTERLLGCHGRGRVIVSSAKYYSITEQIELPAILRGCKADLLHALHFVVPLARCCPTIVTIHVQSTWSTHRICRLGARGYMRAGCCARPFVRRIGSSPFPSIRNLISCAI